MVIDYLAEYVSWHLPMIFFKDEAVSRALISVTVLCLSMNVNRYLEANFLTTLPQGLFNDLESLHYL